MGVTHAFSIGKADGADTTLVQPSNWNAAHTVTDLAYTVQGTTLTGVGLLWSKTTTTTLASFTTAATLIGAVGTGVGTLTLPANSLTVGRTIRIKMWGVYGCTSTAPTLNFLLTLQGVTIATSGAISMSTVSMTNRPWQAEFMVNCRATGASATVIGNGVVLGHNTITAQNSWLMVGALANVNTAATAAIDFTVACNSSNAANTISMVNCTVEVLG